MKILFALLLLITPALAQSHNHHPKQDQKIHEEFYSTWMMPDARQASCCNSKDCYPTEAKIVDGHWQAKRREDGLWLNVPDEKVEHERDNPDGRNHICAPDPGALGRTNVYCFIAGGGT